jgi:hypothetical protein
LWVVKERTRKTKISKKKGEAKRMERVNICLIVSAHLVVTLPYVI